MSSPAPVVAAALAAGSAFVLQSRFDGIVDTFFNQYDTNEQVAALTLFFALVFGFASLAAAGSGGSSSQKQKHTSVAVSHPPPSSQSYPLTEFRLCKDDKSRFTCLYPSLRDEFLDHLSSHHSLLPEAVDWCRTMMDYTVPGGKLNRGTTVLAVLRALKGEDNCSDTDLCRAGVLGWAIEWLQAFFLVADDCMDDSQMRRGRPCWYRKKNVQLIAINDSFLLESCVFTLLRRHFGNESFYTDLVDLFLEVTQQTECGQLLDLTSQWLDEVNGKPILDLNRYTLERYRRIVQYKTAYYSFYLPVAAGMILAGHTDPDAFHTARKILIPMGEYFQIQDDYLDCYGSPEVIGKVGTDIQEAKCSWLVVQALQKVTSSQRATLASHYGQWDEKKVSVVKELYKELELEQMFKDYEEESYRKLQHELDQVTCLPRAVFEILLQKIYKRSK